MKRVFCADCGQPVPADAVALNQRLLGMQLGSFRCLECLGRRLQTSVPYLEGLIRRFKDQGCVYFTRLMEDASDENKHDGL